MNDKLIERARAYVEAEPLDRNVKRIVTDLIKALADQSKALEQAVKSIAYDRKTFGSCEANISIGTRTVWR